MASSGIRIASPSTPLTSRWGDGKIALVTGGTKGIGYSIAQRLGLAGATVIICSRGKKNVEEAVNSLKSQGITVHGFPINVGVVEQRRAFLSGVKDQFGRIDILVSNVAVNPVFGPMMKVTDEKSWDKIFDVNVKSHFFLVQDAQPVMPPGSVVLIISSYAGYTPNPFLGAYSVSKTALIALTKVLATELAPNIRVNCIAPGVIKTKFSEQLWKDEGVGALQLQNIPLGRFGEPDEIGSLGCFLCSPDSSYITGETIVAAGGVQSRL